MKKAFSLILSVVVLLVIILSPEMVSAAPTHNYAEALQKAIYFYECQQAGPLPEWNRVEWRGDATMSDFITGGWYDAGDHVKFNLPMAYSASMLGWALYEYGDGIEASGQRIHLERNLEFVLDYLAACDLGDKVVYQIGDGHDDHKWWGPVEVIELKMKRPYFTGRGSAVTGQMAAALAIGSKVLGNEKYLKHAKNLFKIADTERSDATYTAAKGFYDSWSGFWDELLWAATWLYIATDDPFYLEKAKSYVPNIGKESQSSIIKFSWGHCWDEVTFGAFLMLAKITDDPLFHECIQNHLNFWTIGAHGKKVDYTPGGLAWLYQWGSLRHSTTTAFLAAVYADATKDQQLKKRYMDFAKSQIDYALGSNPDKRSYVVGFGNNPPKRPHHRTAHGAWADTQKEPNYHRHILYGALVGGPDKNDKYTDDISDYVCNEVATDYNAGFLAILCKMTALYGGTPEENFPKPEKREEEFFIEACINQQAQTYTEFKVLAKNHSAWPARFIKNLSFHYYIDISEVIEAGYSAKDITTRKNYDEFGDTHVSDLIHHSGNIYYVKVTFGDKAIIGPLGQSEESGEIQFRISAPQATNFWDPTNDPSFEGLEPQKLVKTDKIPLYDGETKLFGVEPKGGNTPTPSFIYGDVNGDNVVNSTDYMLIKRYVLEIINEFPYEYGIKAADVNADGSINSNDYILVKRKVLEIIDKFPVELAR